MTTKGDNTMNKVLGTWHGDRVEIRDGVLWIGDYDPDDLRDLRDDLANWLRRRGIEVPRYA
jgi:thymidine phosphorylase